MSYLEQLDQLIQQIKITKEPEKLLIGYKAYMELMNDRKFYEDVVGSSMNPNKRRYKKIKIKITQDDFQLDVI
ncbi:hypothetical protein F4V57_03255 [Acinetobacter qingfengensis]|uniref:Uncharacterized protein n=1 Tax=Acinetobacter qingfengensis TaxID=1262585 RepID=A0A1E7RAM4_9GAMM|nr:hypothetical protein [Acinetobacter qingfengensis]KAA8734792.1 hypothetical protein F4V57_03255 [Acinetobacter qingfengensis]OEY96420.1 hypothetical protein BJI46_12015 [Acinetobacter qingfengensis]